MLTNTAALSTLAANLGEALKARSMTVTCAESCTGGMLAQTITSIAGSSAWFHCSFVTYSNTAKASILNVSTQTLIDFGAVSEETANAMVLGAINKSDSDIAVSITGIAGPDGGTPTKPVGTVCVAFAKKNQQGIESLSTTLYFIGTRESVRLQSTEYALKALLRLTLSSEIWNNHLLLKLNK